MLLRPPQVRLDVRAALGCCALLLASCNTLLGSEVGTYQVVMRLEENSCGPDAVNLLDKHGYKVQLRAQGETGYWRIAGQKPLQGSYNAGHFNFTLQSVVGSSPDDAALFCQLQQSEVLSGGVALHKDGGASDAGADAGPQDAGATDTDAGALPADGLEGEWVFTISPVSGTDCTDALPPVGKYQKLPCEVRYKLIGTPTGSF